MPNQDLETLGAEMRRLSAQFEELGRRMTLLEERVILLARLTRGRSDQPQTIAIPHLPEASRRWLGLGKQQTEVGVEQALTSLAMGLPLIADHWLLANARLKELEDRLAEAQSPAADASPTSPDPTLSEPQPGPTPSTAEPAMDEILANIRKVVAFDAAAMARPAAAPPQRQPPAPPEPARSEPALSELPRDERLLRTLRGLELPDERGRLVLELAVQRQPRVESEFLVSCFEAVEFLEPELFRHQQAQAALGNLAASLLGKDTRLIWPQPGRPATDFALEGATSGVIVELLVPGFDYTDAQGRRATMKARARTEPG